MNTAETQSEVTTSHVRGSALLFAGRIVAILINCITQVVVVRYLPKADFGVYAFAISIMTVATVLATFGMDKTASRFLPAFVERAELRRFWGAVYLLFGSVLAFGCLIATPFLAAWLLEIPAITANGSTRAVLAIVSGLALFDGLSALFLAVFAVIAGPRVILIRRHFLTPAFKLTAAVAVVLMSGDVYAYAAGQLAASFLGAAICLPLFGRIVSRDAKLRDALFERPEFPVRQVWGFGATVVAGDLSYLLRIAMVPIVLGIFCSNEAVAAYQSVMPVARLNEFVLMSFSILFLPSAAKLAASEKWHDLQQLYQQTSIWVTLLSFPSYAVMFLGAAWVPVALFGDDYVDSARVLAWLSLGFFTNAALGASLRLLRVVGRFRTLLVVDTAVMLAAAALVFAVVPAYGAHGAACVVCGAYLMQAIAYQTAVLLTTPVNPFVPRCMAPYLAGVAITLVLSQFASAFSWPPIAGVLTAVLATLGMFAVFAGQLELASTFPELKKVPLIGRWLVSAPDRVAANRSLNDHVPAGAAGPDVADDTVGTRIGCQETAGPRLHSLASNGGGR